MIPTEEIIIKVKQRLNKKDTSDYDNLPGYQIVEAYNKGQLNVIHRLYNLNNNYKAGFESTRKRVDDLSILIPDEPKKMTVTKKSNYYITEDLPDDYLHYISSYSVANKNGCEGRILINNQVEESNINTLLNNEDVNPSFEWTSTLVTIASNKLKVYFKDFDIDEVYLTYLTKPINIDISGYFDRLGNPSTTVNSNLPDYIIEMAIDETVRIISGDIENAFGYQTAVQNIQLSE